MVLDCHPEFHKMCEMSRFNRSAVDNFDLSFFLQFL